MTDEHIAVYVEARMAFADRPDIRVRVEGPTWRDQRFRVVATLWEGDDKFTAFEYVEQGEGRRMQFAAALLARLRAHAVQPRFGLGPSVLDPELEKVRPSLQSAQFVAELRARAVASA